MTRTQRAYIGNNRVRATSTDINGDIGTHHKLIRPADDDEPPTKQVDIKYKPTTHRNDADRPNRQ